MAGRVRMKMMRGRWRHVDGDGLCNGTDATVSGLFWVISPAQRVSQTSDGGWRGWGDQVVMTSRPVARGGVILRSSREEIFSNNHSLGVVLGALGGRHASPRDAKNGRHLV